MSHDTLKLYRRRQCSLTITLAHRKVHSQLQGFHFIVQALRYGVSLYFGCLSFHFGFPLLSKFDLTAQDEKLHFIILSVYYYVYSVYKISGS